MSLQQVELNCRRMSGNKMKGRRNVILFVIVFSVFCLFGCSFVKDKNVKDQDVSENDVSEKDVDEKQILDHDTSQDVNDNQKDSSGEQETSKLSGEKNNADTNDNQKDSSSEVVDDTPSKEQNNKQNSLGGIVLPEDKW